MAVHKFQVVLHDSSHLPENDFVNVLYYEVNAPDTVEGTCDGINAAYLAINARLADTIAGMTIKVYGPLSNPQGPEFTKDYANITGGSGTGPMEVAVCLSYASEDQPGEAGPRRRGRIYLGPLQPGQFATYNVPLEMRNAFLDFGEDLAEVGTAGNTTWLMHSRADTAYRKIESIWVDDAWDTQRRRGFAPTARTVRDVQ